MKKLFSILILATVLSCTPEATPEAITKDCSCNKVVDVITMNIVGTTSGVTKYYQYTTVNECSGLQYKSGWGLAVVKVGDCR